MINNAGSPTQDVWHREADSLQRRNAVKLRRWGMRVTIYVGPDAGHWVLEYGLNSTVKSDNLNWQKKSDIGQTWGGGGGGGLTGAFNGLFEFGGNVGLGGTLGFSTNINLNGKSLNITDSGGTNTGIQINPIDVFIGSDDPTFKGATYGGDISANYTVRSLTDKGYVDSHVAGNLLNSNVQNPTVAEDGYVLSWNNTTLEYELVPGGGVGSGNAVTIAGGLANWDGPMTADNYITGAETYAVGIGLNAAYDPGQRIRYMTVESVNGFQFGSYDLAGQSSTLSLDGFSLSWSATDPPLNTGYSSNIGYQSGSFLNLSTTNSAGNITGQFELQGPGYGSVKTFNDGLQTGIFVEAFGAANAQYFFTEKFLQITSADVTFEGAQYTADYSANFIAGSLIDKRYGDSHIGGQNVDTLVQNPTVAQNGYVLSWNNTNQEYELVPQSGGGASPAGANREIQINNAGVFGAAKVFSVANGDLKLGDSTLAGDRFVFPDGTASNVNLILTNSEVVNARSSQIVLRKGDQELRIAAGNTIGFYNTSLGVLSQNHANVFLSGQLNNTANVTGVGARDIFTKSNGTQGNLTTPLLRFYGGFHLAGATQLGTSGSVILSSGETRTSGGQSNSGNVMIQTHLGVGGGSAGNLSIFNPASQEGVPNFQNAQRITYFGNRVAAPTGNPIDGFYIYGQDVATENVSTLAVYTERPVEAVGVFAPSHKQVIILNGVEYYIQLQQK